MQPTNLVLQWHPHLPTTGFPKQRKRKWFAIIPTSPAELQQAVCVVVFPFDLPSAWQWIVVVQQRESVVTRYSELHPDLGLDSSGSSEVDID